MYNMCVGQQSEFRTCTSAVRCATKCLMRGADGFIISLDEDTRVNRRKNQNFLMLGSDGMGTSLDTEQVPRYGERG